MRTLKRFLVTGGAGFIGSHFVHFLLGKKTVERVVNLDLLTYASSLNNLKECNQDPRYHFIHGDILNEELIAQILTQEKIDTIVHFAAETHVDRSISSAKAFIQTNIVGTLTLLEALKNHPEIHFHHISTDEVFGALGATGYFTENTPYQPNSPYSASKASSDHLVRAFAHTYNLSTTISHCSNNYGPHQHTEKFIPLLIQNCLQKKMLPIYGNGQNIRDWLYVLDHIEAIWTILEKAPRGESFNIGAKCTHTNIDLAHLLIDLLAKKTSLSKDVYVSLLKYTPDRPGHDFRYAIDNTKITELGWQEKTPLHEGLTQTIEWYYERFN